MKRITALIAIALACSCSKLPLQKSIDFNPKPLDPHQGVSCWEYISEEGNLSEMKAAIGICGFEDYYRTPEHPCTWLLLDNTAFGSYILPKFGAGDISEIPVPDLKNILLFHIIRGEYSSYNGMLTYDPVHVITLWNDVNSVMTIKLNNDKTLSHKLQDKVTLMDQCGKSTVVRATTSDLLMTNGPAHILSRPCEYVK